MRARWARGSRNVSFASTLQSEANEFQSTLQATIEEEHIIREDMTVEDEGPLMSVSLA